MKDQKTILVVGNFLSDTLASRSVCEDFTDRLLEANRKVITASNKPGRIVRLLHMLWIVWSKRRQYELATVDTFSGPAFFWAEAVGYALHLLRKPFALVLHGGNLPNFSDSHPLRVKWLFRSAAVVTTPSQYLLDKMRAYRADLCLIPNPIELERYPSRVHARPKPRLVWLRAFHTIYNPQLAPRVIAQLRPKFPDITLTMVGPDKGDGALQETQKLIKEVDLQNNIEIIPGVPKNQVPTILRQGDIFINTTNVDNTPVSVLEAMACGLSVVSTNVGGIPYLLEHEENALLVPANNPQAMAAAIERILSEPGLAEKLSRNARCKAEEFDWSVILPQWENLFREIT